jgi:hypothetical protein
MVVFEVLGEVDVSILVQRHFARKLVEVVRRFVNQNLSEFGGVNDILVNLFVLQFDAGEEAFAQPVSFLVLKLLVLVENHEDLEGKEVAQIVVLILAVEEKLHQMRLRVEFPQENFDEPNDGRSVIVMTNLFHAVVVCEQIVLDHAEDVVDARMHGDLTQNGNRLHFENDLREELQAFG